MKDHDQVNEYSEGDNCPVHDTACKKTYTFGSTMSAETDVCVFHGCRCAVAVRHDPIGILPGVATWHPTYNDATGVGRLHSAMASAKYR
jgi:Zn-dependent M28 family amino/carboxypeptidase